MASYPSLAISLESTAKPASGIISERGADGTLRGQALHADNLDFTIIHDWISSTDRSTLETFYSTNREISFEFTWPVNSHTYTCIFTAPPEYIPVGGANRVKAVIRFGEV